MAPALIALVKALAANGLGLIGDAVLAKGKEAVEKTLGVDIESSMSTEQGRIELLRLQVQKEAQLQAFVLAQREQDLKADAMGYADISDSRGANVKIQESEHASWLAKNAGYVLDFGIVGATLLLVSLLLFKAVPTENKEIAFAMLGSLLTLCSTVVQWHRGSSSGSSRKDSALIQAIGKQP